MHKLKRFLAVVMMLCLAAAFAVEANAWASDGKYNWPVATSYSVTAGMYYSSGSYHGATDFGVPLGTSVYAIADGEVVTVRDQECRGSHQSSASNKCSLGTDCQAYKNSPSSSGGLANYIVIKHANNVYSWYGHLTTGSFVVKAGDTVHQGQKIASSGTAGNSSGPHLHLEMRVGGNASGDRKDPQNYLTKNLVIWVPVPPDPNKLLNPMVFNKDYYKASRPELRGMSDSELEQHWIDHGIYESPATPVFDVKWYKNAYAAELGQYSYKDAIVHFVDHGIHEGRASSERFSINYYKDNYQDLKNAFGNNNYEYCIHYINHGWAEGRVANRHLRVYFNANGGTCSVESQPFTVWGTYNSLPTPVRDGYTFLGWYTDSQTGTKISVGSSTISDSDHTIYAHWKNNANYLDINGIINGVEINNIRGYATADVYINGTLDKKDAEDYWDAWPQNTSYQVIVKPFPGYEFVGVEGGSLSGKMETELINLNLKINSAKYMVSFDPGLGTVSTANKQVTYGKAYGQLPVPVRVGVTYPGVGYREPIFEGWYTQEIGGEKIVESTEVRTTSNHTLYAHWSQDIAPVTGVTLNKAALTLTVGEAETLTATVAPANASDQTVTWTSSNPAVATVSGGSVTAIGAGTATITAKAGDKTATCTVTVVEPVRMFAVTFNPNGGSGSMSAQTVAEGGSLTLPACGFTAPNGKQFKAWSIGGKEYAVGATITVTDDTTVTALWEDVPVSDAMRVIVDSKTAAAGQTVELAIRLENNPGIAMTQFKVAYDAALTLESVDAGNVFEPSEMMAGVFSSNPYTVMFFSSVADRADDGTLAVLHFRVNDAAEENSVHSVSVSGIASNIDEAEAKTAFIGGSVTVRSVVYGDVNDDGVVNGLDVLRLGKYLTGWNVTVNEAAADVNGDGQVNGLDQLRLAKYCAGWPVTLGN